MESLYFLVPFALIFVAIAVKVLFWAINNGQYDNLDTEAHRILFDDEKKTSNSPPAEEHNLPFVEPKKLQQASVQHEQDK